MINLISNIESIDEDTKLKMLVHWMSRYLNQQEIVDIIDERIKNLDKQHRIDVQDAVDDATSESDDNDNDFDLNMPLDHFSEPDFDVPAPSPMPNEAEDINTDNTESNTSSPEISNQEELSNIQGEDLL